MHRRQQKRACIATPTRPDTLRVDSLGRQAHCPDSALDWDPSATRESCLADVYNLGGFLSRKRPQPALEHAESYYQTALSHDPDHCPTLGYLAELRLMQANRSAAVGVAQHVCSACGGATSSVSRQLELAFETAGVASWWPSEHGSCAPSSPPSPPPSPPAPHPPPLPPGLELRHSVRMELVVAGTIASFDSDALRNRMASSLGVDPLDVYIEVEAASVRVRMRIESASGADAAATQAELLTLSANSSALASALAVDILSVQPPVVEVLMVPTTSQPPAPTEPPPPTEPPSLLVLVLVSAGSIIVAVWVGVGCALWLRRCFCSSAATAASDAPAKGSTAARTSLSPTTKIRPVCDGSDGGDLIVPPTIGSMHALMEQEGDASRDPSRGPSRSHPIGKRSVGGGKGKGGAREYPGYGHACFSPAEKLTAKEPRTPRRSSGSTSGGAGGGRSGSGGSSSGGSSSNAAGGGDSRGDQHLHPSSAPHHHHRQPDHHRSDDHHRSHDRRHKPPLILPHQPHERQGGDVRQHHRQDNHRHEPHRHEPHRQEHRRAAQESGHSRHHSRGWEEEDLERGMGNEERGLKDRPRRTRGGSDVRQINL